MQQMSLLLAYEILSSLSLAFSVLILSSLIDVRLKIHQKRRELCWLFSQAPQRAARVDKETTANKYRVCQPIALLHQLA